MIYRGIATHQPHLRHKVGIFTINVGGDLFAMISSKQVAATHNTTHSPCMCQHHDNIKWIGYVQWKHFCNLYATEIQWGLLVLYWLVHSLYSYWNFESLTGIEIPLQASFNARLFFSKQLQQYLIKIVTMLCTPTFNKRYILDWEWLASHMREGLVHSSTAHTENVYTDTGHGILM